MKNIGDPHRPKLLKHQRLVYQKKKYKIALLNKGELFGELECIVKEIRHFTVQCSS